MKVNHYEQIASEPVQMEGASGCRVRWLIGEADGAANFAMRQFEVAPGGHTPRHSPAIRRDSTSQLVLPGRMTGP